MGVSAIDLVNSEKTARNCRRVKSAGRPYAQSAVRGRKTQKRERWSKATKYPGRGKVDRMLEMQRHLDKEREPNPT